MSHRLSVLASAVVVLGLSAAVPATAQVLGIEEIRVTLDETNDPIPGAFDGFYPNHFDLNHPKELWFFGKAEWNVPGASFGNQLFIEFDYLDPDGNEVRSNTRVIDLAPGQPTDFDERWTIDFCPRQVSLHLFSEVIQGGEIQVDGTFIHECHVPEPTSFLAWSLLGVTGVAAGWRRRRIR